MKTKKILFAFIAISIMMMATSCNDEVNNDNFFKKQELSERITLKSGVVVEKRADKYYFQDDIMLSQAQLKLLDETGDFVQEELNTIDKENAIPISPSSGYISVPLRDTRSTAIAPTPYNMWAMVRFTYAKTGTLNSFTKTLIQEALQHWEATTNVRFYNATNEPTSDPVYGFDYPYVNFCDGSSNSSFVGRIGGKQDLTLVPFGCTVGTVIHEIGHAIGLLHEQCRFDRDTHITVYMNNIKPEHQHNFTKRTTNYHCIGAFDFNSIMLYSSFTGFEVNTSLPSMRRRDNNSTWVAQRDSLSDIDRLFPNRFYIPYIARSDTYAELAETVYKPDNTIMTPSERLQLQAQLNNGNPTPPPGGRIPNDF